MKGMCKWMLTCLVIFMSLNFVPLGAYAQPDPEGDPDAEVPIDGGVGLLLAAGVGYGIKKWRDEKQKAAEK